MPQEFVIVRCFACETFQVDIKKTSTNKWSCKLCGEKQSLKQIFWLGSSATEGREQVQVLNKTRGELATSDAEQKLQQLQQAVPEPEQDSESFESENDVFRSEKVPPSSTQSKWSKYLEPKNEDQF